MSATCVAVEWQRKKAWPHEEFIAATDPGLNCATVIGQAGADGFRVLLEVVTEDAIAEEHFELVRRKFEAAFPGKRIARLYMDPAGDNRDSRQHYSDMRIAREVLRPCVVIPAPGNNSTSSRVDTLQAQLRLLNSHGEPMFSIHPRCEKLRHALQSGWRYKEIKGSGGQFESKPYKLDPSSHIADALCYFLLGAGARSGSMFGTAPVEQTA